MSQWKIHLVVACWSIAAYVVAPVLAADDAPPEKKSETPAAEAKEEQEDRYQVPETDVAGLFEYIDKLRNYRPLSRQDAMLHFRQANAAILKAAEMILAQEKDTTSANYLKAQGIVLNAELRELFSKTSEERKAFAQKVLKVIAGEELAREQIMLGLQTASILEQCQEKELAIEFYEYLVAKAMKSKDLKFAERATKMQGAIRRLQLVGQPMKIQGKTVAGEPFDLKQLKDKVVLVDFWATWCGPCIGEIPNMLKMYETYHDQGFEIVGVSIDEDRQELEAFLDEKKLPWIILHDEKDEGKPAAAIEYGVSGIPCMILIGKSGKVVSIRARGEELESLLEKEFSDKK